jgi:hypothetical protein
MIDPADVPSVAPNETLARYVLHNSHIRRGDQTVRPDAFIPHPYPDLSVTRHLSATQDEIWELGEGVASQCRKTLHGRADILARDCVDLDLVVNSDPCPGNPNHANILGWPSDKPAQKLIAAQLAANAVFVPRI